jgi:hypothetical protein
MHFPVLLRQIGTKQPTMKLIRYFLLFFTAAMALAAVMLLRTLRQEQIEADRAQGLFSQTDPRETDFTLSDRRAKHDIENLPYGLPEIMRLRPVRYQWDNLPQSAPRLGLIAQEVQPIIDEVVVDSVYVRGPGGQLVLARPAERLGVHYSDLIPVLIKAIQQQQQQIDSLSQAFASVEISRY